VNSAGPSSSTWIHRSGAITFQNGPLAGKPGKLIDGPSIQLGATTCQLAK